MSYTCKFWWPATGTYEAASARVTLKAFERDNTQMRGRNQTVVRTRAGKTLVYDRGNNLNHTMKLQFKSIPDEERNDLIAFLSAVQWGASRVKMEDYLGNVFTVRITLPEIEYTDTGLMTYKSAYGLKVLWDFNLEVLDLTGTIDEYGEDQDVTSPLYLHIADTNDPHNPPTTISLAVADGAKVVEGIPCRDFKSVIWMIVAEKNAQRYFATVGASHDGYGTTDATLVTTLTLTPINDTGGGAAKIAYTVDISGSGITQGMRLKAATTEDGFTIRVLRYKL